MSDAEEIVGLVRDAIKDVFRPDERGETHVRIETLGCGDIITPLSHVTLHKVGDTYRLLVRDDVDWREISGGTYQYLTSLIDYA